MLNTHGTVSYTHLDARLQIYRADTEDGLYTQIADISGTENKEQELKKYGKGQIDFKDESVEAGKTYYYKAKSVLQTENGTMESDFSSPVVFEAKNMKDPLFTTNICDLDVYKRQPEVRPTNILHPNKSTKKKAGFYLPAFSFAIGTMNSSAFGAISKLMVSAVLISPSAQRKK